MSCWTEDLALARHSRARSLQIAGGSLKVRRTSVGLLCFGAAPRALRGYARRGAGLGVSTGSGSARVTAQGSAFVTRWGRAGLSVSGTHGALKAFAA